MLKKYISGIVFLLVILQGAYCFAEAVLIVNKLNPVSNLNLGDVGNIYRLKKTTWDNGNKIDMVNLPVNDPAREMFSKSVYKLSPSQMEKFYFTLALQGKGQPPTVIKNSIEMKLYVSSNINALGYIDINDLDDSVKVVFVDGKKILE